MKGNAFLKTGILFLFLLCVASTFAHAKIQDNVQSNKYYVRAPARLAQGIINLGLFWTPLITEPANAASKGDPSFAEGVFRGISYPVGYAFVGAWDIATFWVPGPEHLPTDMAIKRNVYDW